MKNHYGNKVTLAIALIIVLMIVIACSAPPAPTQVPTSAPTKAAAPAPAVPTQAVTSSSNTTVTIVQPGQMQPIPGAAQPSGWDTKESLRGGLKLMATFDSSGPNAFDPVAHPLVYYTSEGQAKEGSPGNNKLPGVQVINAYSKKVIASALFDLKNGTHGTPHTVGISPDGKWLYLAGGLSDPEKLERVLIINAQTLKLEMILGLPTQRLHHVGGFKDWQNRDRVVLDMGFGATGGPHFILDPKDKNRVVRAITFDDVRPMGHPFTAVDPTGKFMYISMGSDTIREEDAYGAAIAKLDMESGKVVVIPGIGNHPIGIANTSDGKFTYVNDGTNSLTFKIDNATNKVVAKTSAGLGGPYGLTLNWDETELWVIGKGEGSHNRGGVIAAIDTREFRQYRTFNQPFYLGGSASSIDHGILHPDPKVNELWISNMNGWETIVFDLTTKKVKGYIASPNGGDTHSGGFVRYDKDFKGELLTDMLGPSKTMRAQMLANAKAVAPAASSSQPAAPTAVPPSAAQPSAPTAVPTKAATNPQPAPAGDVQVVKVTMTIYDMQPASITVKAGGKVHFVFTNVDTEEHDVVSAGAKLKSILVPGGSTVEADWVAPTAAGNYDAICTIHREIKPLVIKVVP